MGASEPVELGAGEILLTSVDREGTRKGFDVELDRRRCRDAVRVPVIASGGMGTIDHLVERRAAKAMPTRSRWPTCCTTSGFSLADIRSGARQAGIAVRDDMTKHVLVVDYGIGNLLSVCRAFEACGADGGAYRAIPRRIASAERLVVPGVGAFGDGMGELRKRGLVEPMRTTSQPDAPLLGICVGMQMLFEIGEEFGEHEGLGVVPGARARDSGHARRRQAAQDSAHRLERARQAKWQHQLGRHDPRRRSAG